MLLFGYEAHMAPKVLLINDVLKDIMHNEKPFSGKIVILAGDFCQVLPVVKNGSRQ